MLPIHNLDLESAKYIRHPQYKLAAVELTINGKKGYLIQVEYPALQAGYVGIIDIFGKTDWSSILPETKVPKEDVKKYGLPSTLSGVTTDPRIVAIAKQFWDDINTPDGFVEGSLVYSKEEKI